MTPDETIAQPDLADKCASAVERAHGACIEWTATQRHKVARTLREVLVHELQDLSEDLAKEKARADALEKELAVQQSSADEAQLYRAELLRKLEAAEKELADSRFRTGQLLGTSVTQLLVRAQSAESRLTAEREKEKK